MPLVPRRRLWGVALAALALGGCNAIFGVGDLGYGEDAANGAGGEFIYFQF